MVSSISGLEKVLGYGLEKMCVEALVGFSRVVSSLRNSRKRLELDL